MPESATIGVGAVPPSTLSRMGPVPWGTLLSSSQQISCQCFSFDCLTSCETMKLSDLYG